MSDDTPLPFSKNGWEGFIYEHKGTPIGTFDIVCRKLDRLIRVDKLEPHQVAEFDPDKHWNDR